MDDHRLTRRRLVAHGGALAAAATALGPRAALANGSGRSPTLDGRFAEGVMSGDPTPTGITLWSRVAEAGGRGTVELEVARDKGFDRVVARKLLSTDDSRGHAVKIRLAGLEPYEQYYYRFATADRDSPVGRFRTALPPDSRQTVRFAFFSCQDYTFGYFNAHDVLAREEIDFVVNLGDYIYAEAYHRAGSESGGVRTDPVGFSVTLEEYRRKYQVYRSDPSLRRMHAALPMISIWDDHEVVNNYAGGAGPDGGLGEGGPYSTGRRKSAYRAFFESMPTYGRGRGTRIYRGLRFGRNVDLLLIDERQYRDDQPCNDASVAAPCPELPAPRQFLGRRQLDFLTQRLASTQATWKVIANQVMIMNLGIRGGALIGLDSWQGYVAERTELLEHIDREDIPGVVFVTGDIHTFFAGDVRIDAQDAKAIATEFVGGSITSQGLGEGGAGLLPDADPFNPQTPEAIRRLLFDSNPWVKDADTDHHGYGVVTASSSRLECRLRRIRTAKRRTTEMLGDLRFAVTPGEPSLLD